MHERICCLRNSLQTEKACVYWAKTYVLWVARSGGTFRHPSEMGQTKVEGFLEMLANKKRVAPVTHRQALNGLLILQWQVLGLELPWMQKIGSPPERKRHPTSARRTIHQVISMCPQRSTTRTHVLKVAAGGTASPLDALALAA